MNKYTTKQIGDAGENYCAEYLKSRGYKILCRNYRKPFGEIDIIAEKDGVISFVEVKTRHQGSLTKPYEAVTPQKQRKIINAARMYLAERDMECYCSFDVCEVTTDRNTLRPLSINYIENAFETGD